MSLLNQKGVIHLVSLLVVVAAVGIIFFLLLSSYAPFKQNLFTNLYPKQPTQAANTLPGQSPVKYDDDYVTSAVLPDKSTYQALAQNAVDQIKSQGLLGASDIMPNIVIILADDQNFRHLGIAGNPVLKTPNIDSLARPGIYFKNFYVPEGICSPSRASILTGKLPHVHGVTTLGLILPPDQLTFPEILKANGYNTGFIGKCHLGDPNNPRLYTRGFDTQLITLPDNGTVPNWYNYQILNNGVPETHTQYISDYLTDQAINYINQQAPVFKSSQKPFLLWLANPAPHLPSTPPANQTLYSLNQIQLPSSASDNLSQKPPIEAATKMHLWYTQFGAEGMKAKIKDQYEILANLDQNVGRVITALNNQGIRNDTVIVYISDNSDFFGEHQLYEKGPYMYEEQVKVPFIFSYPRLIQNNRITTALGSSMDIMPTLLDLANVPKPNNIQGKSFLPLLQNQVSSYHDSLYFEYPIQSGCMAYPMRAILASGYKLIHYFSGIYNGVTCDPANPATNVTLDGNDFALYNLNTDPFETNNLLRRQGSSDNPLARMLQDPTLGPVLNNLNKERAIWATDSQDPRRFTLTQGQVTTVSNTSLRVTWSTAAQPNSVVDYREKNCASCTLQEVKDQTATSNHQIILTGLKSNTTYTLRTFSFGPQGVGGYLALEGTTMSDIAYRDLTRKADLKLLQDALTKYHQTGKDYPIKTVWSDIQPAWDNLFAPDLSSNYISRLPKDPSNIPPSYTYRYTSTNGKSYYLCATLENLQDPAVINPGPPECSAKNYLVRSP